MTTTAQKTGYPVTNKGPFYLYMHPKDQEPVGCGYYYIVTHGAMSHTAFRTKRELKTWLQQTGLKLGKRSHNRTVTLTGSYTRNLVCLPMVEFFAEYGKFEPFYALDNGDYTIGFIERTEAGNTLHIPNCNYPRPVLDYSAASKFLATGADKYGLSYYGR